MANKSWLERQADSEMKRRVYGEKSPPSERTQAVTGMFWKAVKYCCLALLALVGLAVVWAFHEVFPGFGPSAERTLLLLAVCYACASCYFIAQKVDAIHRDVQSLRADIRELSTRND
jgi:hypothetical protein